MKRQSINALCILVFSTMMVSCFFNPLGKEQGQQEELYQFDMNNLRNELKEDYFAENEISKLIIVAAIGSMPLFADEDYYFIPANERNSITNYYYNDKEYNIVTDESLRMDIETSQAIKDLFSLKKTFYICMKKYYGNCGNPIKTVIMSTGNPIEIDNKTYILQAQLLYAEQDNSYLEELGFEKIDSNWYSGFELNNGILAPGERGDGYSVKANCVKGTVLLTHYEVTRGRFS